MKKGKIKKTNYKKRIKISLIVLILGLSLFAGYFLLFYFKPCGDLDCFNDAMKNCERVSLIKEDKQAVWVYNILGNLDKDRCKVEVRLTKLKEGGIETEILQNKKMICEVLKTETIYPEEDMSVCTGSLKEGLQEILIQRMHNYLLENLVEIDSTFQEF